MITVDGNWRMEGLERSDPKCIKSSSELSKFIQQIGFLPLFKSEVPGFSVEELTAKDSWFVDSREEDPWNWREVIAGERQIAYGKLFGNRAGFISRDWYPIFAAYRRDGYDFDSLYEDGQASRRAKNIIDVLSQYDELPSNELKSAAGFGKGGEKGYESVMTLLQMQTYITVCGFRRRSNKNGEEYGWPVANYCLSEKLFGEDYIRSAYHLPRQEAKQKIVAHIMDRYPDAELSLIEKVIR